VFDFVKITGNVTPKHINGVAFRFSESGAVEQVWSSNAEGEYVKLYFTAK
jgi:hypothetical protein